MTNKPGVVAGPVGSLGAPVPPDGFPRYRVLTGLDDRAFCERVSEALGLGWGLHGSPSAVSGPDGQMRLAQALLWPS